MGDDNSWWPDNDVFTLEQADLIARVIAALRAEFTEALAQAVQKFDGRRACGIRRSPFATPVPMIGMVGGRPLPLVVGRWSMVDGSSDQIAFDGLRGAGGNGSRLQRRDHAPRSQRRCGWSMVGGLADTQITIRHARPDDRMVGGRPLPLVVGRWSMVDGSSDQIAFDGLRGAGGNGSRLQGHRLRRWTVRLRLGHPDHGTWGLG